MRVAKRAKRILKNKRGQANLVFSLGLMLFLAVIFSICMMFVQAVVVVQNVVNCSQIALDTYTSQSSVQIASSIKNGHDLSDKTDTEAYTDLLQEQLFLDDELSCYYENDALKYQLQDVQLTVQMADKLQTTATITIDYPLYLASVPVTTFHKTFSIESRYYLK